MHVDPRDALSSNIANIIADCHGPHVQDHTINITEITAADEIVDQYRSSVRLAKQAGFDGIEILAQGYVPGEALLDLVKY